MRIHQTTAKPYAKAIFSLALEQNQLEPWHEILETLAKIVIECEKNKLLDNPIITNSEKIIFFTDVIKEMPGALNNLIKLLILRKKLILLPDIEQSYRKLKLAHNNTLEVTVTSAKQLNQEQKEKLTRILKERYKKEILLGCQLDTTLIGGAIVQIEDRVIDGSITGMLQRLKQNLLSRGAYATTE